jgi:hypothetical protein
MRTWTLAFLITSAVGFAIARGDGAILPLVARLAFVGAVLFALLAGVRRIALQMAAIETRMPRSSCAVSAKAAREHRRPGDAIPRTAAVFPQGAPHGVLDRR